MIIQIDTDNPRDLRALQIVAAAEFTKREDGTFWMRGWVSTPDTCTCPDSQRGHVCKHRRAARLIEAHLSALVAAG